MQLVSKKYYLEKIHFIVCENHFVMDPIKPLLIDWAKPNEPIKSLKKNISLMLQNKNLYLTSYGKNVYVEVTDSDKYISTKIKFFKREIRTNIHGNK